MIERNVARAPAIRRIGSFSAHRERQRSRKPALARYGKELAVYRIAGPTRAEEDALPIRSPAHGLVRRRMPGDSPRNSSSGRHYVDIDVAVVFAGESDLPSVRREERPRLDSGTGRQSLCRSAFPAHQPEIPRIDKGNLSRAQRRSLKERL